MRTAGVDGYITDFGKNISFEGGSGRVNIDRYGVWLQDKTKNHRYQVVETGNDLAALQAKYGIDDFRVIRASRLNLKSN